MNIFHRKERTTYIIVDSEPLKDDEMAAAFAMPVDDRRFVALMQLIDKIEHQANMAARTSVANPALSSSYTGGAEHMDILRQELLSLREQGFGALSRKKSA